MKLQHLRFFAAVVEDGSITQAARRLHISQPAISAGLKALEDELKRPLFDRSNGRRLTLTKPGLRFHERVVRILGECELAKAELMSDDARRRLRLGLIETLSPGEIATALSALRAQGWSLEIWQGTPEKVSAWLRQGRVDAAWTVVDSRSEGALVLKHESFVCAMSPDHAFAQRADSITLAELAAESFVFRAHCEMSSRGEERIRTAGHKLKVVARTTDETTARQLVAANFGVTLLPLGLVTADLVSRPVRGLRLVRTLGLQARSTVQLEAVGAVLAAK